MNVVLPYPCFICGQRFKVAGEVGKHVEANHLEKRKRSVCDVCGKTLLTSSGLIKHMKTHKNEKTYKCAFCTESFVQWAQRQRHEKAHIKSTVYQCTVCEIFFPKLEALEDHHQQGHCAHGEFLCCDQLFEKRGDYAQHQLIHHRHTRKRRYVEHSCKYCQESFGTLEDLYDHKKNKHKALCFKKCLGCKREICDTNFDTHLKKCNGRIWKPRTGNYGGPRSTTEYKPDPSIFKNFCRICSEEYNTPEDLLEHRKTHPGKCNTFICKICGNCCNRGSQTIHYLKHIGKKKFQCNECDKAFYQKQNLILHQRTHTKERPYKCKDCGKTYVHPSSFREHSFVHSGERPYKCNYCDKAFFRYSGYQSHERTHTGEKPLECKICGRCFAVHATLNAHVKRHYNPTMRIRKGKDTTKYENTQDQVEEVEENWVCEQLPNEPIEPVNARSLVEQNVYTAATLDYVILQ